MKHLPLLALLTLALLASAARAQTYTVVEVGTLPGFPLSSGSAVNNSGQVTGNTLADNHGSGGSRGFLYSNGHNFDLGTLPGGADTVGNGINNSGQVVGTADTLPAGSRYDFQRAFVYSNGVMTALPPLPGDTDSYGQDINNHGQVAGISGTPSTGESHAVLYSDGHVTQLGTLGGINSYAQAVNDSGQVTGVAETDVSTSYYDKHAFLYSDGHVTDLGTLGSTVGSINQSIGNAINNNGDVVGNSTTGMVDAQGHEIGHAFLYSGGVMRDLGTLPGNNASEADGINDAGSIVGSSYNSTDKYVYPSRAFLYRPGMGMVNLNGCIPSGSGWHLIGASSISDTGFITGWGKHNGGLHAFLLKPDLTITDLSPDPVDMGHAAFTLKVTGTKFAPTSVVRYNGQTLATTFVTAQVLQAQVPASLVANSGTADITVQTPHVATSAAATFHIRPLIGALSPSTVNAGASAFTLTVNGSGYTPDALVVFNGTNLATHFASPNKLTATVPTALVSVRGRKSVMVTLPHVATSKGMGFVVLP